PNTWRFVTASGPGSGAEGAGRMLIANRMTPPHCPARVAATVTLRQRTAGGPCLRATWRLLTRTSHPAGSHPGADRTSFAPRGQRRLPLTTQCRNGPPPSSPCRHDVTTPTSTLPAYYAQITHSGAPQTAIQPIGTDVHIGGSGRKIRLG